MQPGHTSAPPTEESSAEAVRKQRFRRTVVLLLLAIVLLLLGVLLLALALPAWQPDGSRPAYADWLRALVCVCLVGGTVAVPVGLRELLLALLPNGPLGVVLALVVAMVGLIAAPIEIWLVLMVTESREPGTQQRYESQSEGGSSWDWD